MSLVHLVDTGPIVALINRKEDHHAWAGEQFKTSNVLFTCESVITEACFLLRRTPGGADAVERLLGQDAIRVDFELAANRQRVFELMRKYRDAPMDLADACLVCMTERYEDPAVLTMDAKDFQIYRRHRNQVIRFISPPVGA